MRAYAIGDIHGHLTLLEGAHRLIAQDRAACGDSTAPVVHIGDLCDRGPDSAGVISYLMAGQARGENWVVLKGNHDRMFLIFLEDPFSRDPMLRSEYTWIHPRLGGPATLASYGVRNPAERPLDQVHAEALALVPEAHRAWLAALPVQFAHGAAVFAHAGIRPEVALSAQSEDDLTWIREAFLTYSGAHPALVVHGHTAIDAATLYPNRLNIDSSAAYGGPLSAVVIEGRDAWLLTEAGRVALEPQAIPLKVS